MLQQSSLGCESNTLLRVMLEICSDGSGSVGDEVSADPKEKDQSSGCSLVKDVLWTGEIFEGSV